MSTSASPSPQRDTANGQPIDRPLVELTQDYRTVGRSAPPVENRCKIAFVKGSGPCPNREMMELLRRRLRIATLITAVSFGAFLVRSFLDLQNLYITPGDRILHSLTVVVAAALAAVLWSRLPLCMSHLRFMEVALFAVASVFFSRLQYIQLDTGQALLFAAPGEEAMVLRLAAAATALRWIVLIVIYGTFIPTTWHRCAIMVGTLTLWPVLQSVWFGLTSQSVFPGLWPALLDMTLMVSMAAVIAIFGSYKISTLHQQAFEARKLGQYRLKQRLGKGGMGEVYLAEHVLLRRPCAIKLIRPDQAGDITNLRRFEREVQETAKLTHWNTVEIYDYGHAADGTFYYVMEYLPGLSLQDLVDEYGPVSPERAVHLVRQVCQGLREAHSKGLIHRDIKPSNIIACERGGVPDVAKLLDFGLVRNVGPESTDAKLTQEGVVAGSPLYLSPEQAKGRNDLDARSDIYSVGGVAYFLLTGQAPFERESALEALMAHVYESVQFPAERLGNLPTDLRDIVLQCLEKEPANRFQNVTALDRALSLCGTSGLWNEEQAASWWRDRSESRTPPEVLQSDPGTAVASLARL